MRESEDAEEEEKEEVSEGEGDGDEEEGVEVGSKKENEAHLTALEEQRMEKKPRMMVGTMKLEDKQRLAQEEDREVKHWAIMITKKWEKYLYQKMMFDKKHTILQKPTNWHRTGKLITRL